MKLLLLTCLIVGVHGDGYGNGIAKVTISASDPISCFTFMSKYFPVRCQDNMDCNTSFTCGTAGRAALCGDETCAMPVGNPGQNFGIHTVNTSARPSGSMSNADVEALVSSKLQAAFQAQKYDSFMDFAAVFYTTSLDKYISAFQTDGVPHLLLSWQDETGQQWYSLLVQLAASQLTFELVSGTTPTVGSTVTDVVQRLPSAVFTANQVSQQSEYIFQVLAVSKGCSNISDVTAFYEGEMGASVAHSQIIGDVTLRTFSLPGANAQVRFVQRGSDDTTGDFKVADLEKAKNEAHTMAHEDIFCGVDKWYDNHFAYDQRSSSLDSYKSSFDENGRIYHIFGSCSSSSMTNMYVVDPTGEAIQLDGSWTSCPSGGSGDALQNACSQGTCSSYTPTSSCSSKLDTLCSSVKQQNNVCTDCIYTRWSTFSSAGCHNADVVNYCVSSSPSPSPSPMPPSPSPSPMPPMPPSPSPSPMPPMPPSPSPSPVAHCDRCAYLVGEQCSGLSGRSCMDCAYSNRARWMPMGCTIPGCEDEVGAACSSSERVVV